MSCGPAEVIIYIDGASRGNPGSSGIGAVISGPDKKELKKLSRYIGVTTNNIAEYTALIYALQEALFLRSRRVLVYSDSELLVKQVSGEYMVKNEELKRLRKQFEHLCSGFETVKVEHVGRDKNRIADLLANQAIEDSV